mmetsp:Transcript_25864/g.39640  ORF Transcript_25864/g.39640 Transcript_25864/m.39640 type:complete len:227 (-) Transcript_25864:241-921(-)
MSSSEDTSRKRKGENETNLPRVNEQERVASTKFLALDTYTWTDPVGKRRKWDVAVRTTKSDDGGADAVVIVPLLQSKDNNTMDTILVEQFRPPMKQPTLEFPAGLIDKEDGSPEAAALRELLEETGYVGKKARLVSRQLCMSPGLTNESVHAVLVEVDLDDPKNQNPQANPDDGEFCTVKRVSFKDLTKVLDDEKNAMPIMGLYFFAMGMDIGSSAASSKSDDETK